MRLRIHGIEKVVRLVLPVIMIKGDAKSQDNIAGRYASHHQSVGRLVWQCDCTPRESRYPWSTCNYLFKNPIHFRSLRVLGLDKPSGNPIVIDSGQPGIDDPREDPWREPVNNSKKILHQIGQYPVNNIYNHLYLGEGVNKTHGIFTAACCDVLHTLKSGIMKYIMTDFFALMTMREKAMFDFLYSSFFRANRQSVFSYSSSWGYPRTSFSAGISNVTKVTANEWVGTMFVSAALCVSVRGHLIFASTMAEKWKKVVAEWKQWCKEEEERRKKKEEEKERKRKKNELEKKKKKRQRMGTGQNNVSSTNNKRQRQSKKNPVVHHSIADASSDSDENDSPVDDSYEEITTNINDNLPGHVQENEDYQYCEPDIEVQVTSETVFDDDPVAYASIWDEGEREPYLDFLFLFETILCFNSWTRMDRFWDSDPRSPAAKETARRSVESVKIMMDGIRRYAPRLDKKGKLMCNGWMIPKYHNLVHIVRQVSNFGPVKISDTESEESNHKEIVKLNAKTVQKRGKGVFDSQLGDNIWQMQAWDLLCKASGIKQDDVELLKNGQSPTIVARKKRSQVYHSHENDDEDDEEDRCKFKGRGTTIQIQLVRSGRTESPVVKCTYKYISKTNTGMILPKVILDFLVKHASALFTQMNIIQQNDKSDYIMIHGCTEVKFRDENIGGIRCHPNYQSEGPWRDWVKAWIPRHQRTPFTDTATGNQGTDNILVLCQVLCFIRRPWEQRESAGHMQEQGNDARTSRIHQEKPRDVTHALLRTTYRRSDKDKEKSSVLFIRWSKAFTRNSRVPDLVLVPITNIVELVGVIDENPEMIQHRDKVPEYLHSDAEREILLEYTRNHRNYSDIVWEVLPASKWANEFNDSASDSLRARYTSSSNPSQTTTTDRNTAGS